MILNKDRGSPDYFKLSKLFNEDYERYSREGKNQKWLGQQFGYEQRVISYILPIYPKLAPIFASLENVHTSMNFSTKDLMNLARVESDVLRKGLVEWAGGIDSFGRFAKTIIEAVDNLLYSWSG